MSDTTAAAAQLALLRENLARVILGKQDVIEVLTIAFAANGCILMEDVPGTGKTTLAKALALSLDADFKRVQFTPDLLPADILGSSIYNPITGAFTFHPGPVFCNVMLADEINRASPRTQSALLEAMSEMQATIEGVRHPLPTPFMVLATQNPVEHHGAYPLPEAQLDRFLVRIDLGYPDLDTEVSMLHAQAVQHPLDSLKPVITAADASRIQTIVRSVRVDPAVSRYAVEIVRATRESPELRLGVSPRGSLMLFRAGQASALAAGRDYVLPDDIQRMAPHVLPHRLMLTPKAKYGGLAKREMIMRILERIPCPK